MAEKDETKIQLNIVLSQEESDLLDLIISKQAIPIKRTALARHLLIVQLKAQAQIK